MNRIKTSTLISLLFYSFVVAVTTSPKIKLWALQRYEAIEV